MRERNFRNNCEEENAKVELIFVIDIFTIGVTSVNFAPFADQSIFKKNLFASRRLAFEIKLFNRAI